MTLLQPRELGTFGLYQVGIPLEVPGVCVGPEDLPLDDWITICKLAQPDGSIQFYGGCYHCIRPDGVEAFVPWCEVCEPQAPPPPDDPPPPPPPAPRPAPCLALGQQLGLGDVNGDGFVTYADAVLIGQHLAGIQPPLTDAQIARANVTGRTLGADDELFIAQYAVGMRDTFPNCDPPPDNRLGVGLAIGLVAVLFVAASRK